MAIALAAYGASAGPAQGDTLGDTLQQLWDNKGVGGRGSIPIIPLLGIAKLGLSGSFSISTSGIKLSIGGGLVSGIGGSIGFGTGFNTSNTPPATPLPFFKGLNATYRKSFYLGGSGGPDPLAIGPGGGVTVNYYSGGGAGVNGFVGWNVGVSGSAGYQATVTIPW